MSLFDLLKQAQGGQGLAQLGQHANFAVCLKVVIDEVAKLRIVPLNGDTDRLNCQRFFQGDKASIRVAQY